MGGASTGGGSGSGGAAVDPVSSEVTVDTSVTYQTLEGFGAAIAWYQQSLANHPQEAELYPILFEELGLDILRLRNRFQRTEEGEVESGITAEIEIVEAATESLGHRPRVLISSWSPPGPLKASGVERCTDDAATCTLASDTDGFVYDEFGQYWLDSLQFYADAGITVDYASIQNEPDYVPPDWEGCFFSPTETGGYPGYDRALEVVAERITELDTPPVLIGPETARIHEQKVQAYYQYLDPALLFGVAHHLYGGDWQNPDSYLGPMLELRAAVGEMPIFQTEYATGDGTADPLLYGGFEIAWLMMNSLLDESAASFIYWELIWPGRGLVAISQDGYTVRDQYYATRHFSRYTEPGDVRVEADSSTVALRSVAFLSPGEDRLTLVLLNVGAAPQNVALDVGAFAGAPSAVFRTVFNPGESTRWESLADSYDPGEVQVPVHGMVTLVYD